MSFWVHNLERWIETACLMEVMTPKPGNVFPGRSFQDTSVDDFVTASRVIAPILAAAGQHGVSAAILAAIQESRRVVRANTSLGIVLLIAPLAAVPPDRSLAEGVREVLSELDVEDSRRVYAAIRLAAPGGIGQAEQEDLSRDPSLPLVDCMRLAAERDRVAQQYVSGFEDVLTMARVELRNARVITTCQRDQIALVALRQLACAGDTLIERKCGREMSELVSDKAATVVAAGWPVTRESRALWAGLDAFLRVDGNRRNPGTTADLIAACVFVALREGYLTPEGDWWLPKADL